MQTNDDDSIMPFCEIVERLSDSDKYEIAERIAIVRRSVCNGDIDDAIDRNFLYQIGEIIYRSVYPGTAIHISGKIPRR